MAKYKFKLGLLYYVRFDDHTVHCNKLSDSEVVGWCVEDHSNRVVLTWWRLKHPNGEIRKRNYETVVIGKGMIKEKKVIR